MKILHVCPHFWPCRGGIERYVEDLCLSLIELGHISDVCCLNTCAYSRERLPAFDVHKKIKIFRVPCFGTKYYKIAPRLLKFAKEYDIVHVHGLGALSDLLAITRHVHKKPLILSTHGGIFHTKKLGTLKKIYFSTWSRAILKKFKHIIAISRQDAELFSSITSNVTVIPNGIVYRKFSEIKRQPKKGLLVYIGRISANKRIDKLIDTLYWLKSQDVKLCVIGGDWQGLRLDLERKTKKLGLDKRITFVGEVSEREKLNCLKRAHLFVTASEYEGFGISVIEAMAAGVPVAVNDITAFRNIIKNGDNGFIVDYSSPKKAAAKIKLILRKDLLPVSKNARKAAKKYDWSSIVKNIENVYKNP